MNGEPRGARFWLRLGGTLLMLVLLIVLLLQQDWQELLAAFRRISLGRLALATLLMFVSRTAVGLRWHVLLRTANAPVHANESVRITYAGLFSSNFLPTTIGGDVVRLFGAVQMRIDPATATASLVMDRLVGMAGMALFLPIAFARLAEIGLPALLQQPSSMLWGFSFAAIPAAGMLRSGWEKIVKFVRRTLADMATWLKQPGSLLRSLLFTLIHQAALYTTIWLLLDGMGEPVGWWQIGGIWSFVYFVTLLPVSINGYGLQEVSTTLLYANMGGISSEASITLALLVRAITVLVSLPGALFAPAIIAASRKNPLPEAAKEQA